MEKQILDLIEEEVRRRVQLELSSTLAVVSRLYEIPIERLIKDTAGIECAFCKGILRSKKRCLKIPKENGYCGFHQGQAPRVNAPPEPVEEPGQAPWE
jgi:hypothetical protein